MPRVFVGHDWAEAYHDVHIEDGQGQQLAKARLPEGIGGVARFHELIAPFVDEPDEVTIAIETDRGLFVAALVAAGYRVLAVNPMSTSRYRERHSTSGAKSDPGDAFVLAELARTDAHSHRLVAGDSQLGRGGQGPRPRPPEPDLDPTPSAQSAALDTARVLPRRARSL